MNVINIIGFSIIKGLFVLAAGLALPEFFKLASVQFAALAMTIFYILTLFKLKNRKEPELTFRYLVVFKIFLLLYLFFDGDRIIPDFYTNDRQAWFLLIGCGIFSLDMTVIGYKENYLKNRSESTHL